MRLVAAVVSVVVLAAAVWPASFVEFDAVRIAADQSRYDEAISGLLRIEAEEPAAFRDHDLDYLLGRLLEKHGDPGAAIARYSAVVARRSHLHAYALFRSAAIARSMGNLFAERLYLRELAAVGGMNLLADAAAVRLGRSAFESADFGRSRAMLGSARPAIAARQQEPSLFDPVARENLLLTALSLQGMGEAEAARSKLDAIVRAWQSPAVPDDVIVAAVRNLDQLEIETGTGRRTVPALSADEHMLRAFVYQSERELSLARAHFNAVITEHPASPSVPEALFQSGRCTVQEFNFSEAIRWFERLIEQYPDHASATSALLQAASAYSRVGKHRESVRRYQDFIARFPSDPSIDRAYLNIIDVWRDAGEETEALKWAAVVSAAFPGTVTEAQATFAEARIYIARNNWDDALGALDRLLRLPDLGGARVPGGSTKNEVAFLRGFVLEQKRSFAEAVDAYLAIPDGRAEYYGWRATERLRLMAEDKDARAAVEARFHNLSDPPFGSSDHEAERRRIQSALRLTVDPGHRARLREHLKKAYSNLPAYKKVPAFKLLDIGKQAPVAKPPGRRASIVERLLFLGLHDDAAPEFDAMYGSGAAAANDLAFTAAAVNMRGGRPRKAVAFSEGLWRQVPVDYQLELAPREQFELLYPTAFEDDLDRHALSRGVDPRLLLSLARQESRFDPAARSDAAAKGLMQFITPTGRKTASRLQISDFEPAQLYDPSTSILFASQYVTDLFTLFPNQPQAVAASYNGGEENMSRWIKRSKSEDPDRYVSEIAYAQSKDYVYKVMASYRVYQLLYDQELRRLP